MNNENKNLSNTIIFSIVVSFVLCFAIYKLWHYMEVRAATNAANKMLSQMTANMRNDAEKFKEQAYLNNLRNEAKKKTRERALFAQEQKKQQIQRVESNWKIIQTERGDSAQKIGSQRCQFWVATYRDNPTPKNLKKKQDACH